MRSTRGVAIQHRGLHGAKENLHQGASRSPTMRLAMTKPHATMVSMSRSTTRFHRSRDNAIAGRDLFKPWTTTKADTAAHGILQRIVRIFLKVYADDSGRPSPNYLPTPATRRSALRCIDGDKPCAQAASRGELHDAETRSTPSSAASLHDTPRACRRRHAFWNAQLDDASPATDAAHRCALHERSELDEHPLSHDLRYAKRQEASHSTDRRTSRPNASATQLSEHPHHDRHQPKTTGQHPLEHRRPTARGDGCGRFPRLHAVLPLPALPLRQLRDGGEEGAGAGLPRCGGDARKVPLALWYANNVDDIPEFEKQMRRKVHYVIQPGAPLEQHRQPGPHPERGAAEHAASGLQIHRERILREHLSGPVLRDRSELRPSWARPTPTGTPSSAPSSRRSPKGWRSSPRTSTRWAMPMNT